MKNWSFWKWSALIAWMLVGSASTHIYFRYQEINHLTQERDVLITTRNYLNGMISRGAPTDTVHHGSGEWTSDSNQIFPDSTLTPELGE